MKKNDVQKFLENLPFTHMEKIVVQDEAVDLDINIITLSKSYPIRQLLHDGQWFFVPDVTAYSKLKNQVWWFNNKHRDKSSRLTVRRVNMVWRDGKWKQPEGRADADLVAGYIVLRYAKINGTRRRVEQI